MRTPYSVDHAETTLSNLLSNGITQGNPDLLNAISAYSSIIIGLALAKAAGNRIESRGAHMFFGNEESVLPIPAKEPGGRIWNVVTWDVQSIKVSKNEIPIRPNP